MNIEDPSSVHTFKANRKLKIRIHALSYNFRKTLQPIAEKSWKGAAIGSLLALIFLISSYSFQVQTGISTVLDLILIVLLMTMSIFVIGLSAKMLFGIVKQFNSYFVAVIAASFIVAIFLPGRFFSSSFILIEMLCGALISYSVYNGIRKKSSINLIIWALVLNIALVIFLYWDGLDKTVAVSEKYWNQIVEIQYVNNPSLHGIYEVKTLNYGSGTDKNRETYGKNVDFKTKSVNADAFFNQSSGLGNYLRKIYWGFNSKNYPINARVWFPGGDKKFPLVLIVHGNHLMTEDSEAGYDYLGQLLASRGFIVASIDENFLNASWFDDYQQKEIFVRAWLILKHLEYWRIWNQTKSNPFYKKVDMDNIVLIGHSRGGAAVAVASVINKLKRYHLDARQKLNFNFSIKGIVQIAPNDSYNPQTEVQLIPENVNFLVIQGGFDQDLYRFLGNRTYNRVRFNDGKYHFKTALYIYRANHGQFNTIWGRKDLGLPFSWLINTKPIMDGLNQRKIAQIYISAFIETVLNEKKEYLTFFKDNRTAFSILPKEYYINQFEDSKCKYIADYEEDLDVNTASLQGCTIEARNLVKWKENALTLRDEWNTSQQNCGVYIGWNNKLKRKKEKAQYSILLNDSSWKSLIDESFTHLFFSICKIDGDMDSLDFTIELITKTKRIKKLFSDFMILPPQLKTDLGKWKFLYAPGKGIPVENVLQHVEIPFSALTKIDNTFKPMELREIRFIFDKVSAGEIILDGIGME